MKSERIIRGIVLVALLVPAVANAATLESGASSREFAVRTWGASDGLPGESVTTILQTSDGYLWVGTSAGLTRFDGVKFTTVRLPTADTNGLPQITALCEDASGTLWVGTQQDGLIRLDETGVSYFRKAQGLLDDNVASLAADAEGGLWIGTRSGLNRREGNRFTAFTRRDGLTDESVSGVHFSRSGVLWITTRGGMYQFKNGRILPYDFQTESQGRSPEFLGAYEDRRGNLWAFGDTYLINLTEGKRFNYFRGAEAASVRIWSLCESRDGRLWIGTSGRGLFCFEENRFQPLTLGELHLPNGVRAIHEDREGSLWLGTPGGGLVQLSSQPVRVFRTGQGLPAGAATCLAVSPLGRTYVGFDAGGLFVNEEGRFEPLTAGQSLEGQRLVSSLWTAPDGALWVATLGDGLYGLKDGRSLHLTTLNGLSDNSVLAVCVTSDGTAWAGTRAGVVHQINSGAATAFGKDHGLPGSPITALLPARAGGLWLGTEDGSVLRGDGERFSIVIRMESASARSVLALHEDGQGRLWIGTGGAGLACWSGTQVRTWNTQNGLPDDTVSGVLSGELGELWLATEAGIYRMTRSSLQNVLTNAVPLACKLMFGTRASSGRNAPFGWPRAQQAVDGSLWFAVSEGVLNVDSHRREGGNPPPPPVYIESVFANDRQFHSHSPHPSAAAQKRAGAPVKAPTDLRTIEFQYTALSFVAPDKLRFRHRLEGFDQDWVNDGMERRVRYGPLPYGEYRFRVAASQGDGPWVEAETPFAFLVPTPLWRSPVVLTIAMLAAAGGVAGLVRLVSHRRLRRRLERLEQQQALERERMRIAQDMHDEIGSKLTKISFLSERARVESAHTGPVGQQIEAISNTSRELLLTLDEIVWAVNPHNDTLEHLAAYLSQYAAEYFQNTAVECEMRLPRKIPHHPLSAEIRHNLFLSFEEALNNVLKHSGAARVRVAMTLQPAAFEISIADNGRGFDVAVQTAASAKSGASRGPRGGNGLVNLRQRLTNVGGQCTIRSQPGQGTTVSLCIPLRGDSQTEL